MKRDWEKVIASIPLKTGVYLMKDTTGRVIYVGKAVNLRSRVRSYFRETGDGRPAVRFLRAHAADIDFILTDSEKEALILENNLIKEHRPRYNIRLRDDKDFLCLRLTTKEKYPRLITLRRPRPSDEPTFGPYSSGIELKKTLRFLHRAYSLRTCSPAVFRSRKRPCLNYELGRCLGPCTMPVDVDGYNNMITQIRVILTGRVDQLLDELRQKMLLAVREERFEDAAKYRDRIRAVEVTVERQKMARTGAPGRDVIGTTRKGDRVTAARMRMREGKVISVDNYHFNAHGRDDEELSDEFLRRLYDSGEDLPREILVGLESESFGAIEEWLSEKSGLKIHIRAPKRGEGRALVELAAKNAAEAMEIEMTRNFDPDTALDQLAGRLKLETTPQQIEGIDISNISGKHAVGSLVRFTDAAPDKSFYRRYRIKDLDEPNDYAMMRQVLERRIRRGIDEGDLPDLILLDGGKGQLNILREVLRDLNAPPIAITAIAKDRGGSSGDRVFVPGRKNHITLPAHAMLLLQRVRDEAHRFAVEYHRRLRLKDTVASELTQIPGIGPSKRDKLLKYFGSLKRVWDASTEELAGVKGISSRDAEVIHRFFRKNGTNPANGATG